jgi:hypothetical protein
LLGLSILHSQAMAFGFESHEHAGHTQYHCQAEKDQNCPISAATTVGCSINIGDTWELHRDTPGNTPSAQAQSSRGRGGWKQQKCTNCNRLRDQPKGVYERDGGPEPGV